MKKVYRKSIIRSVLILLPFLILTGILLYVKLRGFKQALEELVESESSGQYTLTIENSSINISTLSFTFNNLTIQRNDWSEEKGIRVVHIPYLQVRFGSASSMLQLQRFDIAQLVIEEPTIEIDALARQSNVAKQNIIWSQQIVQLYPAVQSLLGRFDIQLLTINRASVGMNKSGQSLMKLTLVDLLVKEWDIRKLTGASQLRLKIGGQALDFGKTDLNFSGIEFNFQQHHLIFSDFKFSSVDTISNSNIAVSGKSLILEQLDYQDLYENKRYSIKRAEIVEPVVIAHFKLKKRTAKVDNKSVLTRLVKHTLGECSVDSAIIRDARVHIFLQQDKDSVKVQLPRVNFKLHAFKVLADSNTFQIGDIEVGLNRTAIALKKGMSLHCDKISFDTLRNLGLTQVMFFDSTKSQTVARCEKLDLKDFDLLDFIFYKHVNASAVSLENGYLQITGSALDRSPSRERLQGIPDVTVHKVSLKNIALRYTDSEKTISADRLSLLLNGVRRDSAGGFRYVIKSIHLESASVNHWAERLRSNIKNLNFNGKNVLVKEINASRDSLHVQIKDFAAEKLGDQPIQKNYRHWKVVSLKTVNITGRPPMTAQRATGQQGGDDIVFGEVHVNRLAVSLTKDKTNLTFTGTDIQIKDIASTSQRWTHGDISGTISDVMLQTPSLTVQVNKVGVKFPAALRAQKISVMNNDFSLNMPSMSIHSISRQENVWSVENIQTKTPTISKSGKQILMADSMNIADTKWDPQSQPVIARLEIFNPSVSLIKNDKVSRDEDKPGTVPIPEHIVIHPGIVHFSNGKTLAFGKIQGSIKNETLECASIKSDGQKMHMKLNGLSLQRDQLIIDSVNLKTNDLWFKTNQWEDDLIQANLKNIQIKNFSASHFLRTNTIKNIDVVLGYFELDVKRDKRLTDPPEKEKPITLTELLQLPKNVGIKSLNVTDGKLQYTETSDKTAAEGVVIVANISAIVNFDTTQGPSHLKTLNANARLYDAGNLDLHYATIDTSSFRLAVRLSEFDLTKLNKAVVPLQSLLIKSGYLNRYELAVTADRDKAVGSASITYKNLHLEIFKPTEPEKRTLGTELLTLLADGIILKHSKKNAIAPVDQPRIKHKSIFNYWVKSAVHGAMGTIRKGKSKKAPKRTPSPLMETTDPAAGR